jgi:hypothetical protein
MAKARSTPDSLQVHIEYLFDRLHDSKLAQACNADTPNKIASSALLGNEITH